MTTPERGRDGLRAAIEAWCGRWSDEQLAKLSLDQRVPLRRARDEFLGFYQRRKKRAQTARKVAA